MRVFASVEELAATPDGTPLGVSSWVAIDQATIDTFAEATGDHQWIHIDPERAASGPFGGTIAHGFLTLSLLPRLVQEVYRVDGVGMAVNYGLDKVRFVAPVPVGSRVRVSSELARSTPAGGGLRVWLRSTVELEGSDKPACVAETIAQLFAA
ncbi:MAG: MaoC family dehydratase [Nitriliruptor sp.]|uniref:MaoC family dehydratase n=1 Tax=Nitriliruptor sp. TaxID=2448056 RepID=UPI0034A007FD